MISLKAAVAAGVIAGFIVPMVALADTQFLGAGATFPYPFFSRAFYAYSQDHAGITVNYASIGSGGGISQFTQKVVDFGAFVNFLGSRDGLVHISELAPHRVGKVADVVKMGDMVKVKVLGFDDRGKVKLSMRQVDQQTGEDLGVRRQEPAKAVP